MNKSKIFILLSVLASFALGFYFYPFMPDQMASHWNINGEVDGYMSKTMGLFFMPILLVIINLLFFFIPKIDPEKKKIEEFKKHFDDFIIVFNFFMLYVYALTIAWNTGKSFGMTQAIMPAFAFLFYFVGVLVGKTKRNYTIGIRMPWTLATDDIGEKTSKKGECAFKVVAIFALLGAIFPNYAWALLFFPLIATVLYLCIYSYIEYKKIK